MTLIDRIVQLFGDGHFVLCKGKRAINNRLYYGEQAKVHAEAGGQIGLWIPDGFIAVDIDNRDEADILDKMVNTVKCRTNHGMHFYFRVDHEEKQRVKSHTPIGLVCDTRTAGKGYCVLPINDDNRQFIDCPTIMDLPFWLEPLNIPSKAPQYIIPNAQDGDGRNDSLLKHVMRLRSFFDVDQIKEIVSLINNKVFADPLPENEISNVISNCTKYSPIERKGENEFLLYNSKGDATGVNHLKIVEYMIKTYRMFLLGTSDLYFYTGGVFVSNGMIVRDIILKLIDNPKYQKQSIVMEVYRLLLDRQELVIDEGLCNYDKRKINFLNGMYDIDQQVLLPHSSDYLSTIQIPFNYIENDLSIEDIQLFDFFKRTKMKNDDIVMILKFMAYCMIPSNNLKCFMCLVGQSNTGKSTLINLISKTLGISNVSNLSIHQLSERFYPSELKDKLLNANADNGAFALTSIENLKKITGNDKIMWERKGQTPYFYTPYARLLFSFNSLPLQVEERSDAFWQRLRILEMNNKVNINQSYYDDLLSDDSIRSFIPILCRILKNLTEIEHSERSKELSEALRNESDSLTSFINVCLNITRDTHDFMTKEDLYISYTIYCTENELYAYKKKDLYKAIEDRGLHEVRRGESRRYGYYGIRTRD